MKSTPVAIFDSWNRVVDRWNRHEETNSPDDLDALLSAIRDLTERQDIGDLPIEHAEQMGLAVGGLGEALIRRFMEARELRDLENGIELYQGAAALIPDSSEWKIRCLLRLPGCHTMRFKQTGDASHLRLAAEWAERALAAAKDGTTRAHALFDLGVILSEQFELNSELGTADAAVDRLTEALACSDPEQPHRKLIVKGLCGMLVKLTLAVPDAAQTGERWQKAIHSVPFRSFDQQTLSTAWRTAFEQRAKLDHPAPAPQPTFVEANRARLRDYAPFNEATELRAAAARGAEVLEVRSYAELQEKLGRIREAYPEALLVFRGQTEFHEGRLAPSMARKNAREGERLLWIAALEENLRYGGPDPAALIERQLMESVGIEPGPADPRTLFWQQVDVAGPAGQAVLQHYGARTHFIDVSTSLEVALWFAHF
ncbi:MAG: FRG domain-containing protein, partial [Usitatibacter sp.]